MGGSVQQPPGRPLPGIDSACSWSLALFLRHVGSRPSFQASFAAKREKAERDLYGKRLNMNDKKIALQGSERTALGTRSGDLPADEIIEISVILKPKARPAPGERVSRKEFAEKYGASPESIARLQAFAEENHLMVEEISAVRRTVKISGTVKAMTQAFGVTMARYQHEGVSYRARSGSIYIPEDLGEIVEAVLGFDNRPQTRAHFRVLDRAATASAVSYSPRQVAQLYDFPLQFTGVGQTIGIIELDGGYRTADIKNYFSSLGIPEPSVTSVSVDQAENSPTNANSSDGEVLLDIEVAGAVAPGAKIVVYFAPNTDQGFQDALTTAIHDTTHQPVVISISWGGPESTWTSQAMTAMDSAAQDAGPLGVTICVAAGDKRLQ